MGDPPNPHGLLLTPVPSLAAPDPHLTLAPPDGRP